MSWRSVEIVGSRIGPLRGLFEVGTSYGSSHHGVPLDHLTVATNVDYTSEGRPRKRPGRTPTSNTTGITNPEWLAVAGYSGSLYHADGTALYQGTTSVVAGMDASTLNSAVYTAASGTTYLIVCDGTNTEKKITGTTASNFTSQPLTAPECVEVAGQRIFFSKGNKLIWSVPNPTGADATDWDSDNELVFAVEDLGSILQLVEFTGYLYIFGEKAVARLDPRDPLSVQDVVLTGFGLKSGRSVVQGKDALYFTDGNDIFRWVPGGYLPQSIAVRKNGVSLVRGTLIEADRGGTPYDVLGYDPFTSLVFASNDTATLAYNEQIQAWAKWEFGASCWAAGSNKAYTTQASLRAVYELDWSIYQDQIYNGSSTVDTMFTWTFRTANHQAGGDADLTWKNLRLWFAADTDLTRGDVSISVIQDGQTPVWAGIISTAAGTGFTLDGSLLGGTDVLGGAGGTYVGRVAFPYPRGKTLAVEMSATNNYPFVLYGVDAQAQARRALAAV